MSIIAGMAAAHDAQRQNVNRLQAEELALRAAERQRVADRQANQAALERQQLAALRRAMPPAVTMPAPAHIPGFIPMIEEVAQPGPAAPGGAALSPDQAKLNSLRGHAARRPTTPAPAPAAAPVRPPGAAVSPAQAQIIRDRAALATLPAAAADMFAMPVHGLVNLVSAAQPVVGRVAEAVVGRPIQLSQPIARQSMTPFTDRWVREPLARLGVPADAAVTPAVAPTPPVRPAAAPTGRVPFSASSVVPTVPASGTGGRPPVDAPLVDRMRWAESRGNVNAVGPYVRGQGHAQGDMQVMDATNTDPGFGVVPARDNSPEERSRVGRDYLAAMLARYNGDQFAATAAYNWGPGNYDRWVAEGRDLSRMPRETRNHIYFVTGTMPTQELASRFAGATPRGGAPVAAAGSTMQPLAAQAGLRPAGGAQLTPAEQPQLAQIAQQLTPQQFLAAAPRVSEVERLARWRMQQIEREAQVISDPAQLAALQEAHARLQFEVFESGVYQMAARGSADEGALSQLAQLAGVSLARQGGGFVQVVNNRPVGAVMAQAEVSKALFGLVSQRAQQAQAAAAAANAEAAAGTQRALAVEQLRIAGNLQDRQMQIVGAALAEAKRQGMQENEVKVHTNSAGDVFVTQGGAFYQYVPPTDTGRYGTVEGRLVRVPGTS